jgi:hypothetical protein
MIGMTRTITATSIQASDLRVPGEPGPVGVGAVTELGSEDGRQPEQLQSEAHVGAHGTKAVLVALLANLGIPVAKAGIDLADLLARAGQVAGQAQPVMPGSFHRPHGPALSHGRSGPGQQLRVARRGGGHLQLRHHGTRSTGLRAG